MSQMLWHAKLSNRNSGHDERSMGGHMSVSLLDLKIAAHRSLARAKDLQADLVRLLPGSWSRMGLPGKPIPSLKTWIEEVRRATPDRWSKILGPHYEELLDQVTLNLPSPRSFGSGPHPREFQVARHLILPPFFMATLPGARVLGPDGVVVTSDGRLVAESSWPRCHLPGERAWNVLLVPPLERTGGCAYVIASPHPVGYYHWLADVLPRLMALEQLANDDLLVVVNDPLTSWQDQSLDLLGITPERRIPLGERYLEPDVVVLPSFPGDPGPHPAACRWLRERFLGEPRPVATRRRLYVTRRLARFRRVTNEAQLAGVLGEFGFEIVEAERLGFAEQVRLFSEAEVVVGPHGGGMANVVFAPEDCRVLEFFQPSYVLLSTYKISANLGQPYWYLLVERDRSNPADSDNGAHMRVDPDFLAKCLATVVKRA